MWYIKQSHIQNTGLTDMVLDIVRRAMKPHQTMKHLLSYTDRETRTISIIPTYMTIRPTTLLYFLHRVWSCLMILIAFLHIVSISCLNIDGLYSASFTINTSTYCTGWLYYKLGFCLFVSSCFSLLLSIKQLVIKWAPQTYFYFFHLINSKLLSAYCFEWYNDMKMILVSDSTAGLVFTWILKNKLVVTMHIYNLGDIHKILWIQAHVVVLNFK